MKSSVDISHKTIFFIAGFLGILWVLFQIKEVILLVFIAVIFMSALAPLVDGLIKKGVPKGIAIAMSYLTILLVFGFLIYLVVTPLQTQTSNLAFDLPKTLESLLPNFGIDRNLLQQEIASFSKNVVSLTFTIFSNVITLISVAVLTFYLLLDRDRLYKLIISLFPHQKTRTEKLILKIENKLGAWMRGQLIISLVIGVAVFILLTVFSIPYAAPLAIFAAFMEIIPVIGAIVSAVPAIFIAYVTSPTVAIFVAIGFFAIQQLESHFIVPQLMKRAVGLNPLIVILAIAIGGKLLGLSGALLAVPITVVVQIILEDYLGIDLDGYSDIK